MFDMRFFQVLLVTLILFVIAPQTIVVAQMGLSVLHNDHQKAAPVEACNTTLPCLSAHQPSMPPAMNTLERFFGILMIMGFIAIRSLLKDGRQWAERYRYRIRQFLYNRVGVHMHAFDALRYWISSGMMVQKVTDSVA